MTPLLVYYPQQSRQLCNTVGEMTWVLRFIANVTDIKSCHRLFFYPIKESVKRTGNTFWEFSWVPGGRLWKGNVLAPFSSVVIYRLLISWSLWNAFCLWKFKNILKTTKFGKLCNDSRIIDNVYKMFVLTNVSKVWCVEVVLFVRKQLPAIYLLKKSLLFSSSFR